MKYIKEYLVYCGFILLTNVVSDMLIGEELIKGNIFKMLYPAILMILFRGIEYYNRPKTNTQ